MKPSTALQFLILGAASVQAAPYARRESDKAPSSNFYLVTTSSPTCASNSSSLPSVSATSLFAPFQQNTYLLRLIGPGYLSLPRFNLTASKGKSKSLTTFSSDVLGQGNYTYSNLPLVPNSQLQLGQKGQGGAPGGGLSLVGCALAVNGSTSGWTLCAGALDQTVIEYKGTDPSCKATYVQAAAKPPY